MTTSAYTTSYQAPETKLRPLREALDECLRELAVRRRCYPRWIEDGKVSPTDAQDRLSRLFTACAELEKLLSLRETDVPSTGDMTDAGQVS